MEQCASASGRKLFAGVAGWALILAASVGCTPGTDLFAEARQTEADAGPSVAAQVVLVEPSPGSVAPQNLAGVVLRFAAPLRDDGMPVSARLRPETGPSFALSA